MDKSTEQHYFQTTQSFIETFLKNLPHTAEDTEKIDKILRFYFRKKTIQGGKANNLAAAIIWIYGRINFIQESEGKKWAQDSVAGVCGVSKSTISAKATLVMKELRIELLDSRFARKEMIEKNPLRQMLVDPKTGFIFNDDKDIPGLFGVPMIQREEDMYYEAMEYLSVGDTAATIRLCKQAINIDEHFVAGYLGLAWAYKQTGNRKKYVQYINTAFAETKKKFPIWPDIMLWGEIENRPFMRAIQEQACVFGETGQLQQAEELFRLLLKMNSGDNQGIRYLLAGLFAGITGEEVDAMTDRGNEKQNWHELDNLLIEQNKQHAFWDESTEA